MHQFFLACSHPLGLNNPISRLGIMITSYRTYRYSVAPQVSKVVLWLLIANVVIFVLQQFFLNRFLGVLGLVPSRVLHGHIWQLLTYMFLHGNVLHVFFNLIFLWMLGSELERYWGSNFFLKYYLVTGIGAGVVNVLVQPYSRIPTIGASGAIFGLIIAFALAFPNRELLLYFVLRIKAKHFAVLVGLIELLALFMMPNASIARFAHLGGLVVGYFYLKREIYTWRLRRLLSGWQERAEQRAASKKLARQRQIRAEVDRILDKINTQGIDSLTARERRFLEKQGRDRV